MALKYNIQRVLSVENNVITLVYYVLQMGIFLYIVVYSVVLQKGYQVSQDFQGTVFIKTKGNSLDGYSDPFDVYEYSPFIFDGSTFIGTRYSVTRDQTKGVCAGNDTQGVPPAQISEICINNMCEKNKITLNGISTGACVNNTQGEPRCEIKGWCPIEEADDDYFNYLEFVNSSTIFIRVDGIFPSYPNLPISTANSNQLLWNYNLFYLNDLVAYSQGHPLPKPSSEQPEPISSEYYDNIRTKGTEISIYFSFDCDLDKSFSKCHPKIFFQREDSKHSFSSGQNYRVPKYYKTSDGVEHRDLYKLYGIKLDIVIQGSGRKFSLIQTVITIAAGIGLLAIARVVMDYFLLYAYKKKSIIRDGVYESLKEEESLLLNEQT